MKKIAFFVEGPTERIFLKSLLTEVFSQKHLSIAEKSLRGGSSCPLIVSTIETITATEEEKFYLLIYDCGNDSKVKSDILEHQSSLISSGYSKIIGIRDLFPQSKADLAKLKQGLNSNLDQTRVNISFVVPVMETEAWFIADLTHFAKINTSLTTNYILDRTGIDLENINVEDLIHPSETLDSIYRLIGMAYVHGAQRRKSEVRLRRTCRTLDYAELYLRIKDNVPSLKLLVDEIDSCF